MIKVSVNFMWIEGFSTKEDLPHIGKRERTVVWLDLSKDKVLTRILMEDKPESKRDKQQPNRERTEFQILKKVKTGMQEEGEISYHSSETSNSTTNPNPNILLFGSNSHDRFRSVAICRACGKSGKKWGLVTDPRNARMKDILGWGIQDESLVV
eukprot:TRINITY_DN1279_c0_g2_i5.p1 TRINITY_DN1279_c0_g2~~TRINITY_DN1279_c0_g2_i5.p1  ORF type:complete len:154 (-),score=28.04 TRINITY_DN1279_c0_g2_i5:268-729(-)